MRRVCRLALPLSVALLLGFAVLEAWNPWFSRWRDGDNIVMDQVFLPNDPWGIHADVTDAVRIASLSELPALLGI